MLKPEANPLGYFAKYRKYYKEPERYTTDIARERRLAAVMKREAAGVETLSRVESKAFVPRWKLVNDDLVKRQKAGTIAAAVSQFREKDFADAQARAAYRKIRQRQEQLRNQQKVSAAGADKRQFNPTGKDYASTVYGGVAGFLNDLSRLPRAMAVAKFAVSGSVVPCIERIVRREVLFAKGKGGVGYKTPKRRTWSSGVPC